MCRLTANAVPHGPAKASAGADDHVHEADLTVTCERDRKGLAGQDAAQAVRDVAESSAVSQQGIYGPMR